MKLSWGVPAGWQILFGQVAWAESGGGIAPVMMATASDMEWSRGLMTAMRRPSRWM
jgi:hypothetical protein